MGRIFILSDHQCVDKMPIISVVISKNILEYFSLPRRNLKHFVFTNFALKHIIKLQTQKITFWAHGLHVCVISFNCLGPTLIQSAVCRTSGSKS